MAKMQENTDRDLGRASDEIVNECMVLSALQSTELALALRPAPRTRSSSPARCRGPPTSSPSTASSPRRPGSRSTSGSPRRAWGSRALVWSAAAHGRAARRGHRRHHPRLAHAAARRRPPRGGLRRLRAAAGARPALLRARRHRLPRLRPHHQRPPSRSSPSACRATSASACRSGSSGTRASRSCSLAVMGCVVNGPGEIEGGQHRHLASRHRRSPELPGLHRRPALRHAARHLRRARRAVPDARRRLRGGAVGERGKRRAHDGRSGDGGALRASGCRGRRPPTAVLALREPAPAPPAPGPPASGARSAACRSRRSGRASGRWR